MDDDIPQTPRDLEDISWLSFWQDSDRALLGCATISAFFSAFLCVVYWRLPHVRRTPGQFVVQATFCDFFVSLCFVGIYFCPKEGSDFHHLRNVLWTLLLCAMTLEIAANVYRSLMYSNLISIYRNPFKPERHRPLYTLLGWICAVVAVIFFSEEFGTYECDHCFHALCYGLVLIPLLIFTLGAGMYLFVRLLLHAGDNRTVKAASISNLAQQRVSRHGLAYLVLYGVQHLVGLAFVLVLQWEPRLPLLQTFSLYICIRPTISCLGWLVINDVVYIVFGVFSFTKRIGGSLIQTGPSALAVDTQIALAAMEFSTAAAATGGSCIVDSMGSDESSRREVEPVQTETAYQAMQKQGMEDGFKEELRFELLYDIARSIGDSAHSDSSRIDTRSFSSQMSIGSPSRARTGPNRTSATGSWSNDFPTNTDDHQDNQPEALLTSAGLLRVQSEDVLRVQARTGVIHHAERDFRQIRDAFGIRPMSYARDFPSQLSEFDSQWRQKLKESVSEGASGTFFYRVMSNDSSICNSRFIVKQITAAESHTLMRILPHYRNHVVQRKGRSLIQYFGSHSVPLRWKFSGNVHFVVMRNFLPVKPWLSFDLKGATANRRALSEKLLHNAHTGADPRGGAVYGTLRDWEWMDIAMVADLSPQHKAELVEMVAADSEFLKSQGLLDYSLLVGIHRLPSDLEASARDQRLLELEAAGGYPSVDRQKVYFFGIIDVLEQFNLRWHVQHFVLRAAYGLSGKEGVEGISAVPPAQYADRFFTFVQQEVLQDWPAVEDEEHDEGTCLWRVFCCSRSRRRILGGKSGGERWGQLWQRRRRGLVRERIEVERADFLRRLEELERQLQIERQANQMAKMTRRPTG